MIHPSRRVAVVATVAFHVAIVAVPVQLVAETREPSSVQVQLELRAPPPPPPPVREPPAPPPEPSAAPTRPLRSRAAPVAPPELTERPLDAPDAPAPAAPALAQPAEPPPTATPSTDPPVPIATRKRGPGVDLRGYAMGVREALLRHRQYPAAALRLGLEGTAKVRLSIDRGGKLAREPVLLHSTGHTVLDEEAIRVARSAAPFAPLPTDADKEVVVIVIPIEFRIDPS